MKPLLLTLLLSIVSAAPAFAQQCSYSAQGHYLCNHGNGLWKGRTRDGQQYRHQRRGISGHGSIGNQRFRSGTYGGQTKYHFDNGRVMSCRYIGNRYTCN